MGFGVNLLSLHGRSVTTLRIYKEKANGEKRKEGWINAYGRGNL